MRACWLKCVGRDWSISADYIWLNYSDANTIKGRLKQLTVKTPTEAIPDGDVSIAEKVSMLRKSFEDILGL